MEIYPKVDEQQVRLARKLLALGYTERGLETTLKKFRTDDAIFREENVPRFARLEELWPATTRSSAGSPSSGTASGRRSPSSSRLMSRATARARARVPPRRAGVPRQARRARGPLRQAVRCSARKSRRTRAFPTYMRYAFAAKHRFDYTPEDCARFHAAVEQAVVPRSRAAPSTGAAARRRHAAPVGPRGDLDTDAPLRPVRGHGRASSRRPQRIFDARRPELGAQFRMLAGGAGCSTSRAARARRRAATARRSSGAAARSSS